jgi:hypothetical protein
MKIAKFAVVPTAFLHLKGPDGNFLYDEKTKERVGIDLYGPGSPVAAELEGAQSARIIKRMQDNDNKVALVPVEQRRVETAGDLTALTARFHHIEYDGPDGQPLTGTALHTAVYSDPTLGWINVQAMKFVADWGKFTPGSPTS